MIKKDNSQHSKNKPKMHSTKNILTCNLSSKCGEIFYLNKFSFVCFCGCNIESFLEFKSHFEKFHLDDFVENNENTTLLDEESVQNTEDVNEANKDFLDPLNLLYSNDEQCTQDYVMIKSNMEESSSLPNSDRKEVQKCQLESTNDNNNESSNNLSVKAPSEVDNIDWTKPYEPQKHHIKRAYKPRDKQNACTYCGRTFRRRYQLDTHSLIHTGEKPQQCEQCGRRFRALTTLQRHLSTHEKRFKHNCKFCTKSFTHKAALFSHELTHNRQRIVPCDECEKKFYTINQFDTHKRRVHHKSTTLLPFACDLCTNRYRSASMLSTHKLRKHLKTAKFDCEKCDKKFSNSQKLMEHQVIHIPNKILAN